MVVAAVVVAGGTPGDLSHALNRLVVAEILLILADLSCLRRMGVLQ